VLQISEPAVALVAALMLRGAQTSAELRTGAERLYRFADMSSVEAFLDELAARAPERGGALVKRLPRRPGEREARWIHCLSAYEAEAEPTGAPETHHVADVSVSEIAALKAQVTRLELDIVELRGRFEKLERDLGQAGG